MKTEQSREAWNKGKLVGQKPPLRPKDVWAYPDLPPERSCCPRSRPVQPGVDPVSWIPCILKYGFEASLYYS
ncbi:hypothetical protein SAMN05192544_108424 [Paraburkholderia hospita]|nr:hypothetical protein SAMN05192544_108424 [Paraburkholderia hospita]